MFVVQDESSVFLNDYILWKNVKIQTNCFVFCFCFDFNHQVTQNSVDLLSSDANFVLA